MMVYVRSAGRISERGCGALLMFVIHVERPVRMLCWVAVTLSSLLSLFSSGTMMIVMSVLALSGVDTLIPSPEGQRRRETASALAEFLRSCREMGAALRHRWVHTRFSGIS